MDFDFKEPNLCLYRLLKAKKSQEELRNYLVDHLNLHLYRKCIASGSLDNNEKDLTYIESQIKEKLNELQTKKEKEPENHPLCLEMDKKICELYAQIFDSDKFEKLAEELMKNDPSSTLKMDILLCKIRTAIILENRKKLILSIEEAKTVFEISCDWDRKNKFKVYLGLFYIMKAEFEKAANILSECLASFEATELLKFENMIFYLVFSALLSFSRTDLKETIINNSEIRKCSIFLALPEAIYECSYSSILLELLKFVDMMADDIFLCSFTDHFCKMIKIRAYEQLLSSYQSLHIAKMAQVFCINSESLEEDLRNFINEGKLSCVIDRIEGVVRMNQFGQYDNAIDSLNSGIEILRNIRKNVD